jgi:hypothetical protein
LRKSGQDALDRAITFQVGIAHLIERRSARDLLGNRGNQYTGGRILTSTLPSRVEIAAKLGISAPRISEAQTIIDHSEPNIIEMAKTGKIGIQAGAALARYVISRRIMPSHPPLGLLAEAALVLLWFENDIIII